MSNVGQKEKKMQRRIVKLPQVSQIGIVVPDITLAFSGGMEIELIQMLTDEAL
jgi:hypothetical protein